MYSVVILAGNEQAHIGSCIESITPIADEVIVVDDYSHDDTPQIAYEMGATVMQRALDNDWAQQRNFALDKVSNDWTFMIDADERLDDTGVISLSDFSPAADIRAASIGRSNYYKSKPLRYGRFSRNLQIKALESSVRYQAERPVHETPDVEDEEITKLNGNIEHFTYVSLGELFAKMKRYGEIEAQSGQRLDSNLSLFRSVKVAGYRLLVQQAYRDGLRGLIAIGAEMYGDYIAQHEATS